MGRFLLRNSAHNPCEQIDGPPGGPFLLYGELFLSVFSDGAITIRTDCAPENKAVCQLRQ